MPYTIFRPPVSCPTMCSASFRALRALYQSRRIWLLVVVSILHYSCATPAPECVIVLEGDGAVISADGVRLNLIALRNELSNLNSYEREEYLRSRRPVVAEADVHSRIVVEADQSARAWMLDLLVELLTLKHADPCHSVYLILVGNNDDGAMQFCGLSDTQPDQKVYHLFLDCQRSEFVTVGGFYGGAHRAVVINDEGDRIFPDYSINPMLDPPYRQGGGVEYCFVYTQAETELQVLYLSLKMLQIVPDSSLVLFVESIR